MQIVDPTRVFEVKTASGGTETCKLLCAGAQHTVGANRTVVPAVAGKIVRVMGMTGSAEIVTGYGSVLFRNGSGGASLTSLIYLYQVGQSPPLFWPITDSGYFETTTGNGLFIDVAVNTVNLNVFYIAYTP